MKSGNQFEMAYAMAGVLFKTKATMLQGNCKITLYNHNANRGWQPGVNMLRPGTLDQQLDAFMDGLANMNISDEEILLNTPSGIPTPEPGVGWKIVTLCRFVGFNVASGYLEPSGEWLFVEEKEPSEQRRMRGTPHFLLRVVIRTVREESRAQVRDELRARFESRPRWMQRYIQRVMDEDWVDDSD
jgi:hypothetical protein